MLPWNTVHTHTHRCMLTPRASDSHRSTSTHTQTQTYTVELFKMVTVRVLVTAKIN